MYLGDVCNCMYVSGGCVGGAVLFNVFKCVFNCEINQHRHRQSGPDFMAAVASDVFLLLSVSLSLFISVSLFFFFFLFFSFFSFSLSVRDCFFFAFLKKPFL